MAKTTTADLSNADFLVVQLRDISKSAESSPSIRLQALDRLAVVEGIYKVGVSRVTNE